MTNRLGLLMVAVLIVVGLAVAVSNAAGGGDAYQYPDLPFNMEDVIATETDCDDLLARRLELPDWNQPASVKRDASLAIAHRSAELGC